jgi:hypothetical protein
MISRSGKGCRAEANRLGERTHSAAGSGAGDDRGRRGAFHPPRAFYAGPGRLLPALDSRRPRAVADRRLHFAPRPHRFCHGAGHAGASGDRQPQLLCRAGRRPGGNCAHARAAISPQPQSESDSNRPSVGLCFSFLLSFWLSLRRTGGGAPSAVRAMDLTAVVAVNFLRFFFFLGTADLTTKDATDRERNTGRSRERSRKGWKIDKNFVCLCVLCG